jgi:hypothetical protein
VHVVDIYVTPIWDARCLRTLFNTLTPPYCQVPAHDIYIMDHESNDGSTDKVSVEM